MGDLLTPANIVVAIVVVVALVVGGRRAIGGLTKGKSCCTDGSEEAKVARVVVDDTDESHYPYRKEFLVGGMSCENCAKRVQSAIDAAGGTWTRIDLANHTALVLAKGPIDDAAVEAAVKGAGYYVMKA